MRCSAWGGAARAQVAADTSSCDCLHGRCTWCQSLENVTVKQCTLTSGARRRAKTAWSARWKAETTPRHLRVGSLRSSVRRPPITSDITAMSQAAAGDQQATISNAQARWELENEVQNVAGPADLDALYRYDADEQKALLASKPWTRDPHYFKRWGWERGRGAIGSIRSCGMPRSHCRVGATAGSCGQAWQRWRHPCSTSPAALDVLQGADFSIGAAEDGHACQERRQHRGHGRNAGVLCLAAGPLLYVPRVPRVPAWPLGKTAQLMCHLYNSLSRYNEAVASCSQAAAPAGQQRPLHSMPWCCSLIPAVLRHNFCCSVPE